MLIPSQFAVLNKYKPSSYRCELTGLSRFCNLYFVACGEHILVYQPVYPNQVLGAPVLIVPLTVSGQGQREGDIRTDRPHYINRMLVAYLGHKEIVLCACDDGDVVGFYVSAIQAAVQKQLLRHDMDEEERAAPTAVRDFFCYNVRRSAWGLAVHRDSRKIAISSNTHEITVVQFYLTTDKPQEPSKRPYHVTIFQNARNNVPFLSFDNTGTDPEGKWLLGGDIDGKTFLFDLADPAALAARIRIGICHAYKERSAAHERLPECSCDRGRFQHAMWGGYFIDQRRCHQAGSQEEALGGDFNGDSNPDFWNITDFRLQTNLQPAHPIVLPGSDSPFSFGSPMSALSGGSADSVDVILAASIDFPAEMSLDHADVEEDNEVQGSEEAAGPDLAVGPDVPAAQLDPEVSGEQEDLEDLEDLEAHEDSDDEDSEDINPWLFEGGMIAGALQAPTQQVLSNSIPSDASDANSDAFNPDTVVTDAVSLLHKVTNEVDEKHETYCDVECSERRPNTVSHSTLRNKPADPLRHSHPSLSSLKRRCTSCNHTPEKRIACIPS